MILGNGISYLYGLLRLIKRISYFLKKKYKAKHTYCGKKIIKIITMNDKQFYKDEEEVIKNRQELLEIKKSK